MNKIAREQADLYQDFFNFLNQEHNLTCTIEEMDEIIHEAQVFVKKFDIANVVVNEANWCNECKKPIRMVNNTLQLLCECNLSEMSFNCIGGNFSKGIKPCDKYCGDNICLKP